MNTASNQNYFALRNVTPEFYHAYRLPAYVKRSLPPEKSAVVLDIGCGFGQMLLALRREGYTHLRGVDVVSEAVDRCRQQGLDVELITNLEEYCAKQDPAYDFVVVSHVIEHLPKAGIVDTLRAIRSRLMKPGASLLVAVPNAQSNTGCYWAYEDFTHSTLFTAGSLQYVLKAAGFERVTFLDPEGLWDTHPAMRWLKMLLLRLYRARMTFWNKVTGSSFHKPSPAIFTYELKAIAK